MNMKSLLLTPRNAALFMVTCALIGTGLMLELRMDEEDGSARLFGMGRDDWGEIHLAIALGFAALSALHLLLNWSWIKVAMTKAKWAIPMLAAGLGLVATLLLWPTDRTAAGGGEKAGHHQGDDD